MAFHAEFLDHHKRILVELSLILMLLFELGVECGAHEILRLSGIFPHTINITHLAAAVHGITTLLQVLLVPAVDVVAADTSSTGKFSVIGETQIILSQGLE